MNAPFKIEIAPDLPSKEQAFSCPTTEGVVRPGEKTYVSVFFHPEALDSRTVDYFSITPAGSASQTLLKVVGFCRGTGHPRTPTLPFHLGAQVPAPSVPYLGVCCPLAVQCGILPPTSACPVR